MKWTGTDPAYRSGLTGWTCHRSAQEPQQVCAAERHCPGCALLSATLMAPAAALHQHFGFAPFRPGQEAAVRAAIGPPARDVLVVMPTGAGKSLCYQLPALVRDDVTLVVSPLVALIPDQ